MKYLPILILIFLSACAPMPGNDLYSGLKQEADLDEVKPEITIGFFATQTGCHQGLIDSGHIGLSALVCITNACIIPACALTEFKDGKVDSCKVFLSWDIDFMREHELRHCKGYRDRWY